MVRKQVAGWTPLVSAGLLVALSQACSAGPQPAPRAPARTEAQAQTGAAQTEAAAQTGASAQTEPPAQGEDFPRPPADPAAIARGKQIFSVNCGFCHGADGRGGEGGPNLLRSPLVLNDQKGEVIHGVLLTGRPDKGMPKFNLSLEESTQIAAYLHSIPLGRGAGGALNPKDILVGDAAAGKTYFYGKGRCNQCHSLQGDFAHIGARFDPKTLQDNIVSGAVVTKLGAPLPTAPPRTVTVTLESGEVLRGNLLSIDDFSLSYADESGHRHTLPRHGELPAVVVKNPMQAHLDMLRNWEDRDIHNLTAFLAGQQ